MNPAANPAADPNLQKGRHLDLFIGLNLYVPRGTLKGNRLVIEGGLPIYQYLEGPQLETDWQLNIRWTDAF